MKYIIIYLFILYLVPGILNFAMLNSDEVNFVKELNDIWTNKRWKRIVLRLTWILLWPMYFAWYILLIGLGVTTYFIKEIIK